MFKTILALLLLFVSAERMALADPILTIDVRDASSIEADTTIRPGVVAYGLGYQDGFGGDSNLDTLKQYLDSTSSSNGDVVINTLGVRLMNLTALTGSPDFDVELDDLLSGEIQDIVNEVNARLAGGRVQITIYCSLPDHLSLYPGVRHDAQNGMLQPTEHPISACGPIDPTTQTLDNGKTPQEEWAAIMEKVADLYRSQNVYFVIGSEPSNYFNGTFEQFLSFAKYTASGLRSGDPEAEIGILGNDQLKSKVMRRTNPVFVPEDPDDPDDDPNGHYELTVIMYEKPLVEQYLEYIHNNQLDKIDAIQYRAFNTSPSTTSGAFWHKDAAYIDELITSLGTTNDATNGPVKLMVTDYPNYHTTCSDNIEAAGEWNGGESIWDSEYLAAMYTSAYLGMAVFNQQNLEPDGLANIARIEPHLAFLVIWATDFYFHTSCEADGSSPAGFGGSLALNSELDIPKPIAHVLDILDALDGKLTLVASSDDNLFAYSGYKSQNDNQPESLTLVVSQFVPTEAQVNTFEHPEGAPKYELSHLWTNNGSTNQIPQRRCPAFYACQDTLNICCTAQEFQDLVYAPDGHLPRDLTRALIVDNAAPNLWGLFPAAVNRLEEIQVTGQANRAIAPTRNVDIVTKGLVPSIQYLISLNTIDDVTGNAYTDRYALQTQLETEWDQCEQTSCAGMTGSEYNQCMKQCMQPLSEQIKAQYSFASTAVYTNVPVWTNASGELNHTLSDVKKNSVHLMKIVRE